MFNLILSILLFAFIPHNEIETGIKNYLGEKLHNYSKWNYTVLTNVEKLIRKNSKLEIDKQKDFQIKNGYGYIPVKENGELKSSSSTFVTVKLNLYKDVLVATRKISAGSNLAQEDFEIVEKDVTTLKEEPVENYDAIAGCSAKMNIGKETILLQNMIRAGNVIKVGEEITAIYSNGGVDISFSAKARTEGRIGERIQIVSKDNKVFRAKIVSAGSVIITEQ